MRRFAGPASAAAAATLALLVSCGSGTEIPCLEPDDCPGGKICGPLQTCIADELDPECRPGQCSPPIVETLPPDSFAATSLRANLRLTALGIPPVERAGICWAVNAPPAVDPAIETCVDATVDASGAGSVVIAGLPPGASVHLRAYADNGRELVYGDVVASSTIPATPALVDASDALQSAHVEVDWSTVSGALHYRVTRDERDVASLVAPPFVDTGATPAPRPGVIARLEASLDLPDRIELSWSTPATPSAPTNRYAVVAVGATGESLASPSDTGSRAAYEPFAYEVSEAGGAWFPVGPRSPAAIAADEVFEIDGVTMRASRDGDAIALRCEGDPVARLRTFRVRAVSEAGTGDASPSVGGRRGDDALRWRLRELQPGASLLTATDDEFDVLTESSVPTHELADGRAGMRLFDCSLLDLGREIAHSAMGWGFSRGCAADSDCEAGLRCYENLCAPPGTARVLAGRAWIGIDVDTLERDGDELLHEIELTSDVFFGTHEVTRAEWEAVMGNVPARFAACGPDCPALNMTWDSAIVFANRLSELDGLQPCYLLQTDCAGDPAFEGYVCGSVPGVNTATGSVYDCEGWRLPTEAEWEVAARGPVGGHWESGLFPISDDHFDCIGSVPHELDAFARFCGNAAVSWEDCAATRNGTRDCAGPAPVGSYLATTWGLFDMYGNVAEFVWDAYAPYDPAQRVDPEHAPTSVADEVLWRGGYWYTGLRDARASDRNHVDRNTDSTHAGVRLVRTAFD